MFGCLRSDSGTPCSSQTSSIALRQFAAREAVGLSLIANSNSFLRTSGMGTTDNLVGSAPYGRRTFFSRDVADRKLQVAVETFTTLTVIIDQYEKTFRIATLGD